MNVCLRNRTIHDHATNSLRSITDCLPPFVFFVNRLSIVLIASIRILKSLSRTILVNLYCPVCLMTDISDHPPPHNHPVLYSYRSRVEVSRASRLHINFASMSKFINIHSRTYANYSWAGGFQPKVSSSPSLTLRNLLLSLRFPQYSPLWASITRCGVGRPSREVWELKTLHTLVNATSGYH